MFISTQDEREIGEEVARSQLMLIQIRLLATACVFPTHVSKHDPMQHVLSSETATCASFTIVIFL